MTHATTRLVLIGAICLTLQACDRDRATVRNDVESTGTRATHARDRVESRVERSTPKDARVDAGPGVELSPVGDTQLSVGPIDELDEEDGMAIERQVWSFQGIRGVALRVRVPLERAKMTVVASDDIEPLGELVDRPEPPFAAINGGFYDVDGEAMGLVIADGDERSTLRTNGGSGVVSSHDGELRITHRRDWEGGADHAIQSIDRIISGGETLMKEGRRERHTARSGVALGDEQAWIVVMYEDASAVPAGEATQLRSTSFRGVPLWAFARYLLATTDVREALNLDGAVSTQLVAKVGQTRIDLRGERGTINALVLSTK